MPHLSFHLEIICFSQDCNPTEVSYTSICQTLLDYLCFFLIFLIFYMFDKNILIYLCQLIKCRIYGNFHEIKLETVDNFYIKGQKFCYKMS